MANQAIQSKPVIEVGNGADQSVSAPLAPQGQWSAINYGVNRYGEMERVGGKELVNTFDDAIMSVATSPDGGLFVETRNFTTGVANLYKIALMQN